MFKVQRKVEYFLRDENFFLHPVVHGMTGPAPNFPEPETNPAETPASPPCRVHSLNLCPRLPERIKGTRLPAEISAESPL
ncbi:unnamed protein product [Prunus armeniaca]